MTQRFLKSELWPKPKQKPLILIVALKQKKYLSWYIFLHLWSAQAAQILIILHF